LMWRRTLGAGLLICLVALAGFAADGKVETVGPLDAGNEALRKALAPGGYKITLGDGSFCEVWFRATMPTGKTDASGAVYTSLPEGALIGVIRFQKDANDFRGQSIKAGSYTMRYEVHPTDGNHMGISPIRDFLLLVPLAADTNPEAALKFDELVKLSTKASGTNHPAALSMAMPGASAAPAITTDEHNHTVFAAKVRTASGEIPIAFVVKGVAEQ
ncbi:MAG TPA: hypothetical protein VJZ91_16245, partial [Blastocatellia bacterium]|nr:hypothetical protein [Blastocatellia bacterium]